MINTITDLQSLVVSGETNWKQYGNVNTQELNGLILFNYSPLAQIEGNWNYFERISRGLILNRATGEIVARPFDKFYNWLEGGNKSSGHIVNVTEKMDGSLGILYRSNGYRIATRGSMKSEQALWATKELEKYILLNLPPELTLLFEIIYPENRVVVDYHGWSGIVLLAARNRLTGDYVPYFPDIVELADKYHFTTPPVYGFNDLTQIIERCGALDIEHEGFVVEFSDGQRFKFKGDRYLELHRLISSLTFKNVLAAVASQSIQQILEITPDEFLSDVKTWIADIESERQRILIEVEAAFNNAPQDTRKDFALWVQSNHKSLMPYLFAKLDNKPLDAMIYKAIGDNHKETNTRIFDDA